MRLLAPLLGMLIGGSGLLIHHLTVLPDMLTVSELNPVARSLPDALLSFWTYLTHLSNLGLVLVYASELVPWRWLGWFRQPVTRASLAAIIGLVMVFFHFMLASQYSFEGWLWVANMLLHYGAPLYYFAWWAAATRHGALRWRDLPLMLLPGIVYLGWVLARGAVVHEYPYEILNVDTLGYGGVASGVSVVIAGVVALCVLLVIADKLLANGRATSAGLPEGRLRP